MEWFEETFSATWRQRFLIDRVVFRGRTRFQDVLVFETAEFGRVLALDGIVQTTERDEFTYHEMIAHVPIMGHGSVGDVLIIGGGDGGTLAEVLKHVGVRSVTLVEIDPDVVEICREHMPLIAGGAFEDARTRLIIGDGAAYVHDTDDRFDVVIVDSTDPVGPGEVLFAEPFYAGCHRVLRAGGVLAAQCGNMFPFDGRIHEIRSRMGASFADVGFYLASVPSYVGGPLLLGWASNDPAKRAVDADTLMERGVPEHLRYYTPAIHVASFALPACLLQTG